MKNRMIPTLAVLLMMAAGAAAQTNVIVNGWLKNALMGNGQWVSNAQIDASSVTSGVMNAARLPGLLPALALSNGASLGSLNATNITAGTISNAFLPLIPSTLLPAQIQNLAASNGTYLSSLNASALNSGMVSNSMLSPQLQLLGNSNGLFLVSLNATSIITGTIPVQVLPSALSNLNLLNGFALTNLNGTNITGVIRTNSLPTDIIYQAGGDIRYTQYITNVLAAFGSPALEKLVEWPAGYTRLVGSPWVDGGSAQIDQVDEGALGVTVTLTTSNLAPALELWMTMAP